MRIAAKWGFGNAPLKSGHRQQTLNAIAHLRQLLDRPVSDRIDTKDLDAISHIKGQFSRTLKQDQWDWYTVWSLLGRPSRALAISVASLLATWRRALRERSMSEVERIRRQLIARGLLAHLEHFVLGVDFHVPNGGFIYILSTRSHRRVLKVGMTRRDVVQRAKEINRGTGVVVPFGVRASWPVGNPVAAERVVHKLLDSNRIRDDREFFEIDFIDAYHRIDACLREHGMLDVTDRTCSTRPNSP